jgi:opacity protein-like surface antigen
VTGVQTCALPIYYIPSAEIEVESFLGNGTDDGDGFGIKGEFAVAPNVYLTGEYQGTEYDDSNLELDQLRLGAAFGEGAGTGGGLYGRIQYLNISFGDDDNDDESGVGGHIGFALAPSPEFKLYGEAGYLKFDDVDGPEFLVGAAFQVAPNIGIFADYRTASLEDDNDNELTLDDFRVGARFYF